MLNIKKTVNGNKAVFALEGRLDTNTSVELDEALKPVVDGVDELLFDLGSLDYISSAGLRVLLATHKIFSKKNGMKVTNVNEMIMEIFEVTGFSDILTIE
ncbi:STAS domain-containing protein [Butyrivibrio sp. AE2032]|uniref:STAS domain-containing protein n=1 Tax=Butyrivibrio sp. AE2032 TaxID=1458463 RepID=UPI000B27A8C1|nr:STAS domain-containing protein [Butyrivibrio sp. AE2032]